MNRFLTIYVRYRSNEIILFLLCLIFFHYLIFNNIPSDIALHVGILLRSLNDEFTLPPNYLYYALVYALSLFSTNNQVLLTASAYVLSSFILFKYCITKKELRSVLVDDNRLTRGHIEILGLLLISAFSLPGFLVHGNYYLGQLPPNVWHNSTTIVLMPIAIWLFSRGIRHVESPTDGNLALLSMLVILNILAKPSYFFVFGAVFPMFMLSKHKLGAAFFKSLLPVIIGAAVIILQYKVLYHDDGLDKTSVGIELGAVWSRFSPSITGSILLSTLYPLGYLVFNFRKCIRNNEYLFSLVSMVLGILIAYSLIEKGHRAYHGNFFWQAYVANYILFLSTTKLLARDYLSNVARGARFYIPMALFLTHVISGIGYIYHYVNKGHFI